MPLLCRDCKHALRRWFDFGSYQYAKCAATIKKPHVDLVTGKKEGDCYNYCSTMRRYDCGEDGKLWEPR